MRNERVVTSWCTLSSLLLAGALVACGGSGGGSTPKATLQSIAVTPGSVTLAAGTQQKFAVTGTYSDKSKTPIASGITWSSSDPTVATVDASGTATGVAGSKGTATITGSVGGLSGRAAITVTVAPLTSITVSAVTTPVFVGRTQQLVATGHYADGTSAALTSGVTWSSSNTAFATVDSLTGLANAVAAGTVTITATETASSFSATVTLTVSAVALQSITVSAAVTSITVGADLSFTALGVFNDGSTQPLTTGVTWSSSDPAVATVDSTGFASSLVAGTVNIIARDDASGISGSASLTVNAAVLQSITISPAPATVAVNVHLQFSATGNFSNGTSAPLTGVSWSSSNAATASVDGTGTVLGVQTGSVVITATVGAVSQTVNVTVTPPVVATDVPASFSGIIDAGGQSRFTVIGLAPGVEYLVRITSPATLVIPSLQVQDASFAAQVDFCFAGGLPCRGGIATSAILADPGGNLFLTVSGDPQTHFTVDVSPLPLLTLGAAFAATVDTTETYFKLEGLTPGAFTGTLSATPGSSLTDPFADLAVYDNPHGAFGGGALCYTILADPAFPKTCAGTVPASGTLYITVEGWATTAGTDFTLTFTSP